MYIFQVIDPCQYIKKHVYFFNLYFYKTKMLSTESTSLPVYKLSDVLNTLADTVHSDFGGPYWITAELSSVINKKGYWVLELQESAINGTKIAKTQAMVWTNHVNQVIYKFKQQTKMDLSIGMNVKIFVEASFHPQWGFRFSVLDIDSGWTLGNAENNNDAIRQKLEQEKIWKKNVNLKQPKDFCHIAIVSPSTSAGLDDFLHEAIVLQNEGLLSFDIYNAPFEGENAKRDLCKVFNEINCHFDYDAVCFIRGGGSASGISWLNQEDIVRSICLCRFPVISGIGHERDSTLIDEVANIVCGTPSKTIGYIISTIIQSAQSAQKNWEDFILEIHHRLKINSDLLNQNYTQMNLYQTHILEESHKDINRLMTEALYLGPEKTVQRGYAYIQNKEGKIITEKKKLTQDVIQITVQDGKILGRFIENKEGLL